jgi:VIT1/CCC1 family predicted Fe2+/Mn2+ transporter
MAQGCRSGGKRWYTIDHQYCYRSSRSKRNPKSDSLGSSSWISSRCYVSVSSQSDIETADLERERKELETMPEAELKELAKLYQERGLDNDLAMQVAVQITKHDVLQAHARDELGINDITRPKPLQAALASGASFVTGGLLPLFVSLFAPVSHMVVYQYCLAIVFLALSGAVAAKAGGSSILKGIMRICFWGTIAMVITAFVGYLFG